MVRRLGLPLFLIAAGFVAGIVATGWVRAAETFRTADAPRPAVVEPAGQPPRPSPTSSAGAVPFDSRTVPLAQGGPDFTRVAGQAVKGVANISSLQVISRRNAPLESDPFFRYFFGDDPMFGGRDRRSLSLGSGVNISAGGHVVNHNHVVRANVREITV